MIFNKGALIRDFFSPKFCFKPLLKKMVLILVVNSLMAKKNFFLLIPPLVCTHMPNRRRVQQIK